MKKAKNSKPSIKKVLLGYGFHIWFLLFLVNVVIFYTLQYNTHGQTCLTSAQVQSDSRCLYILNGKVYEKGTRSSPHQGHPCGTDVTSIIPSFHTSGAATYLDPNYVGDICVAQPSPTVAPSTAPSTVPSQAVTSTTPSTAPSSAVSIIPSPGCLGTTCTGVSPSSPNPSYGTNMPSITLSGIPNYGGGNNGGGNGGGSGGGGFFGFFFSLIELFLALLLKLLGVK